jgi:hypothetical protein
MKKIAVITSIVFSLQSQGQIIYDPTTIHDEAGAFYHAGHVYTLELQFYNANYHNILKTWKENYLENTLPAKLDYGSNHFDSVAVKYKGNSTFSVPGSFGNQKLPYNIDLNDIVSGQEIEGYKKLKLGNCWFDPTFAREVVAAYIYKQYLPSYEANLIRLHVNGNYLGIYVNEEDIGAPFLKKHFGEKDGPFFKCEPMTQEQAGHAVDWPDLRWRGADTLEYFESYERKSEGGWDEFLDMIHTLNYDPANIESVINVDRVLWNFAVTQVLSNEDTYNTTIIHNYYMYQTADGKFQMIPWDLTESFCGILFSGGSAQSHYELDPLYGLSPYFIDRPLVYQLLSNSYYRKRYFAHMRTIISEFYTVELIENLVLDLQATAYNDVNTDPNKPHNMTKFANNVNDPVNYLVIYTIAGITDVIEHRRPYLLSYPDLTHTPPAISNVSQNIQHPSASETVHVSAAVSNATSVKLRVTNTPEKYASDFMTITMLDDGLNGDAASGDGIYTATIPFTTSNDHIKYYIEAENANAMMLSPERAEYFYYHYYIDQVVGADEMTAIDFSIYPNPASDWLNVEATTVSETFSVSLYTISGEKVFSETELHGKSTIDIHDLSRGTYIVEIISGKSRKTEKIILN